MRAAIAALLAVASVASAEPLPRGTFTADPLLWMFDEYWDIAGAVGVGRHAAIQLSFATWRSGNDPAWHAGHELALGVPIYIWPHRFEGIFVEPHLVLRTADNSDNTHDYEGPGLLVGVQHTWACRLTVAGAIGENLAATTMLSSYGMSTLDGYVHIGYAF